MLRHLEEKMYNDKYLKPDWRTAEKRAIRDGVGIGLVKIGKDERVVVLDGDLAGSTRAGKFEEKYPDRFFQVGVAEQNLAGLASGMASEGFIPFVSSYATFSPGRNWEQIRISIALSKQNVKIIGSHGGVATGVNGPSHQALEDIALMRVLPNITVLVPADATQCARAIEAAYHLQGPVYIRTARPEIPDFTRDSDFEIGKAYVYREGKDITIGAAGIHVWEALKLADEFANKGIDAEVINISTVKPLDEASILDSVTKTGKIVTMEDHQAVGGIGSAIAELVSRLGKVKVMRIGVEDRFGVSGNWDEVYSLLGLDRESIRTKIATFL